LVPSKKRGEKCGLIIFEAATDKGTIAKRTDFRTKDQQEKGGQVIKFGLGQGKRGLLINCLSKMGEKNLPLLNESRKGVEGRRVRSSMEGMGKSKPD